MKEINPMMISILTPSYNQGRYIERNILSVLNQHYPSFEHIIIDGGSTDNTVEILQKYPHLKWVSEKDNGQADALNKGLEIATGEIIGWINSDDFYEPDVLNDVAKEFEDVNIQWIVGNIKMFYEESKRAIPMRSPTITHSSLLKDPDIVKQQATFFRKTILQQLGGWNSTLQMIMDYDLWLRLARISTPKMIDKWWANFTHQAEQKSHGRNNLEQLHEMLGVMKREGAPRWCFLKVSYKKYLYSFKFHIKSRLISMGLISSKYLHLNLINRNGT